MKKIVEMIKLELADIAVKITKLEQENMLAFQTEQWKILHAQREVLAKMLNGWE